MIAYHATMRSVLFVKARVARAPMLSDDVARALSRAATAQFEVPIDEAFVRAVAAPPRGRLNAFVFERLGERFAVPPELIWERSFPPDAAPRGSQSHRVDSCYSLSYPMTRGFIFDLDGTLADTMPAHYRAWMVTAKLYGLDFPEDLFYGLGGMPTWKIAGMLVEKAGVMQSPRGRVPQRKHYLVASLVTPGIIQPIAPVVEIARAHRAEGPLAIASGGQRHLVERTLGIIGIADWFSVVLSSEDTTLHKPEPDVFLEAARRLGVEPANCTVYEDTDIGLEAARRANMRGVDVRPFLRAAAHHLGHYQTPTAPRRKFEQEDTKTGRRFWGFSTKSSRLPVFL